MHYGNVPLNCLCCLWICEVRIERWKQKSKSLLPGTLMRSEIMEREWESCFHNREWVKRPVVWPSSRSKSQHGLMLEHTHTQKSITLSYIRWLLNVVIALSIHFLLRFHHISFSVVCIVCICWSKGELGLVFPVGSHLSSCFRNVLWVYFSPVCIKHLCVFRAQPWKKKLQSKLSAVFWMTQVFSENVHSVRIGLSVIAVYIIFSLFSFVCFDFLWIL